MDKTVKRVRVFAGPNGSGKTTIINAIRQVRVNGRPIDFGIYVNADDIARDLMQGHFNFRTFHAGKVARSEFVELALASGLINGDFPEQEFRQCFTLHGNDSITLNDSRWHEHLAQVVATFLRERLMELGVKFSFETVFSHPSKVEFLRRAALEGYKVYLYFIATEDPKININRVRKIRVAGGGHDVPEQKIVARYKRSLGQVYEAAQHAYQAYFFDNSADGELKEALPFAHFKMIKGRQGWDEIDPARVPAWFIRHYIDKALKQPQH